MQFNLDLTLEALSRTPQILQRLLRDLDDEWARANQGSETWSPFDIIGHFIHGERTDWVPRARMILQDGTSRAFEPFDRFAQYEASKGKTMNELLDIFEALRGQNVQAVKDMNLGPSDLHLKGVHPELGEVTLEQLLATWMVHDLAHIGQIAEVMRWQFKKAVGPWAAYLPWPEEDTPQ
jgi:hypothetical protein